jgi:hypothetical protein
MYHSHLTQCKKIFAGVITITALCAHYTTVIMAQPDIHAPPKEKARAKAKEQAHWNDDETTALINYLYDHCAEGDEGGNFKQSTYQGAVDAINDDPILQASCSYRNWC